MGLVFILAHDSFFCFSWWTTSEAAHKAPFPAKKISYARWKTWTRPTSQASNKTLDTLYLINYTLCSIYGYTRILVVPVLPYTSYLTHRPTRRPIIVSVLVPVGTLGHTRTSPQCRQLGYAAAAHVATWLSIYKGYSNQWRRGCREGQHGRLQWRNYGKQTDALPLGAGVLL